MLRNEPGIMLTGTEERSGKYHIYGFRDPLATDPASVLAERSKLEASNVVFHWEPYHAIDANLVLLRAKNILAPPESVSLRFEDGVLFGEGTAPRLWILEARELARTIPGIERFRDEDLLDQNVEATNRAMAWLEKQVIHFTVGTTQLVDGQEEVLRNVAVNIDRLRDTTQLEGKGISVTIIGHTDSSGDESRNMELSRQRADRIAAFLVSKGIDSKSLETVGVGTNDPVRQESSESDRAYNRSVTFKVSFLENLD
jgi:OOP family OmpA-OmpF porin